MTTTMTPDEQYYYYMGRVRAQEDTLRPIQAAYEEKLDYVRSTITSPQIVMDKVKETAQALLDLINNYETTKTSLAADQAAFAQIKAQLGK